jgi:bifunctional DNase/RNase
MLVPCSVESVRVHVLTNQHVVLLQAEGVRRLLPIWIGPDQAYSIATRIAGITSERPLTHDLIVDMLTKIGAEITRVVVKDLVADEAASSCRSPTARSRWIAARPTPSRSPSVAPRASS